MTAKRTDNGELEVVKVGNMTFSYRMILLLMVASATPLGEPVLKALGVTKPETRLENRFIVVEQKMEAVHADVEKLNKTARVVEDKLSQVDFRLTGFQVDFEKYKQAHP